MWRTWRFWREKNRSHGEHAGHGEDRAKPSWFWFSQKYLRVLRGKWAYMIEKLKAFFPAHLHPNIFMVGGMVRDLLLGVESQDIDLAGAVPHEDLAALGFRLVQSKSTPDIYFRYHKTLGKIEFTPLPHI